MGDKTGIQWTDATWNPIAGCSVVSPACTNCYAMAQAARIERMMAGIAPTHYTGTTKRVAGGTKSVWTGVIKEAPERQFMQPMRWTKPRRIFVNSMSDLFHENVADETIDRIFAVMALAPQHTFQCLTKRPARMREYICGIQSKIPFLGRMPLERIHIEAAGHMEGDGGFIEKLKRAGNLYSLYLDCPWPLRNVWLGTTAEDQQRADERIPDLLATPAAVRFVSIEPMLGPVDLTKIQVVDEGEEDTINALTGEQFSNRTGCQVNERPAIDWVIAGGESGPGARPMHPDWARSLRDECKAAGVPFFVKQMHVGGKLAKDIDAFPEDLRAREFPNVAR